MRTGSEKMLTEPVADRRAFAENNKIKKTKKSG